MIARSFGALIIACASAPAIVCAQAPDGARSADSAVLRLPEIQVRATRAVTTAGGSSAIEVAVDSLSLSAAPAVEEVLRAIPLLHVRTNARGEAEISARGSESRQVAVLVDGVPISLSWDGRTDVSVIPAGGIQELSYVRGLSSMLHGPNVLGGVIEVSLGRTTVERRARFIQVATDIEHVGGYGASGTIGLTGRKAGGEWLVRTGAAFRDSPGRPLAAGVHEPGPARKGLRANTDARNANGFVSLRYRGDGGAWLSLSASGFRAERGIAAELGVDRARFWRYPRVARTIAVTSGGTGDRASPFGGRGDIEISLGFDAGTTRIDSYRARDYREIDSFENGEDRTVTLRLLADQSIGARGELRGAFTVANIQHDEFLPLSGARYRQRLVSFGGENVWRLVESGSLINSLRLSVGGAYDMAATVESGGRTPQQDPMQHWGARAGLTAALNGGNILLHTGISRRARFPALREMYSGALDRFQPNPALRPEKLLAAEAGVTARIGFGDLQVVAFRHLLHDAVVRIATPELRFLRINRDKLGSSGVEILASQLLGSVQLTGDLMLQAVSLTDPRSPTPRAPENLPEASGRLRAEFALPFRVRAGAETDFTGSQFCLDPGSGADTRLSGSTHLNLELTRHWLVRAHSARWFSRVQARVLADNALGTARYDQCGLPQPGRLLRFQLRLM